MLHQLPVKDLQHLRGTVPIGMRQGVARRDKRTAQAREFRGVKLQVGTKVPQGGCSGQVGGHHHQHMAPHRKFIFSGQAALFDGLLKQMRRNQLAQLIQHG